jgi:hypothetical protein
MITDAEIEAARTTWEAKAHLMDHSRWRAALAAAQAATEQCKCDKAFGTSSPQRRLPGQTSRRRSWWPCRGLPNPR